MASLNEIQINEFTVPILTQIGEGRRGKRIKRGAADAAGYGLLPQAGCVERGFIDTACGREGSEGAEGSQGSEGVVGAFMDMPCGREGSKGSKGSEGSKGEGGRLRRKFL